MKTLFSRILIIILALVTSAAAMAATVSGNISYTGASTGRVYVVIFTDSTFRGKPTAMVELASPGSYALPGLSNGTYYIISLMMCDSNGVIQPTDPWGYYGTPAGLTPVSVTGGNSVSGIDISLVNGTVSDPNPFYTKPATPNRIMPLAEVTRAGRNPSIAYDGSFIYLYKHDYENAPSAKIFKINPSSGQVTATNILSLQSSANGICWIGRMTYHKGAFWASGGYGEPTGTDKGTVGVFKIDIAASRSSNQMPAGPGIDTTNELGGLASDGVNLYVGVDLLNAQHDPGVVKFDPSLVSAIPAVPFFPLDYRPSYLCYANNYLWAGVDSVKKMDPANGTVLASYFLPGSSAQVYLDGMLWTYDQSDNALKAYTPQVLGVGNGENTPLPSVFSLSQNYPNPFNPSTVISYQLPVNSVVTLRLYDLLGREVATLVNGVQDAGVKSVEWSGGTASGVYYYRLEAVSASDPGNRFVQVKKMMLLK